LPQLGPHLPPWLTQLPWHLLYCSGQDGFSLRTLYQCGGRPGSPPPLIRDSQATPSPAALQTGDTESASLSPPPFGAFSATTIRCSSGFYGMGETFLFSPELKVFMWTGRNNFFMKGGADLLMVGGGSGRFGLGLDGDLHHGGRHPCETFDDETLSPQEELCVQDLEVWGLT
ncbi:TLDC2 protein, partial [Lophotis ruficrista]|nr:TLDC2 protein [Lophotis ruficrista]